MKAVVRISKEEKTSVYYILIHRTETLESNRIILPFYSDVAT